MNESFKEAIEILVSNHYLTSIDHKLVITNKFTRELEQVDVTELFKKETPVVLPKEFPDVPKVIREVIKVDSKTRNAIVPAGQQSPLTKFIIECEIPTRVKSADGKFYWASKYSKEAEKELANILNQGYQYDILVAATRLYYKAGGMVEAISNFIVRGTWMTHYQEMEKALRGGKAEQHINTTIEKQSGGAPTYEDR